MVLIKSFAGGVAAAFLFAVAASAQDNIRYPFQRPGAVCLKLELPLFAAPKEEKPSSLATLPHYVGSDKSISAEPGSIQTIAHAGYIGLAAAGVLANPAFLIVAAYHIAALVKQGKSGKKVHKRHEEINFIWSRR